MNMFSCDIFIKVKCLIVAHHHLEAQQLIEKSDGIELTVPHDEFFSDRFFSDPLLRNLTFSTSFTLYGLDETEPFYDFGPANKGGEAKSFGAKIDTANVFSGTTRVAATIYIKADSPNAADSIFRALNNEKFDFAKRETGVLGVLGRNETDDFAFATRFICSIPPHLKLSDRGPCASYSAVAVDRGIWTSR